MAQLTYDARLQSEPLPTAIDFLETPFFKQHDESGSSPQLPDPAVVRALRPGMSLGTVAFENLGLFVKFGRHHEVRIEEAQSMQAVRRAFPNNEVLLPELIGWRSDDNTNFIYMSFIKGVTLGTAWPMLAEVEKDTISSQLRGMIGSLRSLELKHDKSFIGSVSCTKVQDIFFRSDAGAGPFSTVKDFNDRVQFYAAARLPLFKKPLDPFRPLLSDYHGICFSHADLHVDNILIDGEPGSRSVVAIVDWGMSGWYPEYWEYCKMMIGEEYHPFCEEGWLSTVLAAYDDEYYAFATYWQLRVP